MLPFEDKMVHLNSVLESWDTAQLPAAQCCEGVCKGVWEEVEPWHHLHPWVSQLDVLVQESAIHGASAGATQFLVERGLVCSLVKPLYGQMVSLQAQDTKDKMRVDRVARLRRQLVSRETSKRRCLRTRTAKIAVPQRTPRSYITTFRDHVVRVPNVGPSTLPKLLIIAYHTHII